MAILQESNCPILNVSDDACCLRDCWDFFLNSLQEFTHCYHDHVQKRAVTQIVISAFTVSGDQCVWSADRLISAFTVSDVFGQIVNLAFFYVYNIIHLIHTVFIIQHVWCLQTRWSNTTTAEAHCLCLFLDLASSD